MAKSSPTKLMGAIGKLVKKALKEAAKPKVAKKAPTKLLKPQLIKKVAKAIRKKNKK
jgi:hypothetical protein